MIRIRGCTLYHSHCYIVHSPPSFHNAVCWQTLEWLDNDKYLPLGKHSNESRWKSSIIFFTVHRIITLDQNEEEIKMLQRWLKILTNTILRNVGFIAKLSSSNCFECNCTECGHIITVYQSTTQCLSHPPNWQNISRICVLEQTWKSVKCSSDPGMGFLNVP